LNVDKKEAHLLSLLRNFKQVMIAFSGGVDSTYLAAVAYQVLGKHAVAVTLHPEYVPAREIDEAKKLASQIGIQHKVITLSALKNGKIAVNPKERCFFCKMDLFTSLTNMAKTLNIHYIIDGSNADDMQEFRPGIKALNRLGIISPLKEAGLTKEEVRFLSKRIHLPTWNKASFSCLATRIPYGQNITERKLKQLEQAEDFLFQLGFKQFRVRHHDTIARIEILSEEFMKMITDHQAIVDYFKQLGFHYITLDLQGYRTGSLNEILKAD